MKLCLASQTDNPGHGALQLVESGTFLIYNKVNKLCLQASIAQSVRTATCHQDNESQKFRWITDHECETEAMPGGAFEVGSDCDHPVSVYEQAYLTDLVGLRPGKYFWLGLSDMKDQGTFRSYRKILDRRCFKWHSLSENSESALTWHQARKSYQQQNSELLSITEIHEQEYMGGLEKYGFHHYLLDSASSAFTEAIRCEQSTAFLATVESRNKQAFLVSLTRLGSEKYFWIGLFNTEE
ncbi:hypothetical protein AV530_014317 [Patagioenas fasciata monilis]|uniref:C-type lectin domain-containing protein n=1 Tax=Patagioenas fasciata monilis TaxID=372326 RepID=A0A1V4KBA5_PATFA|nr:hypothetical protein AV530_014317 [Patagioenas fasciata monilis]